MIPWGFRRKNKYGAKPRREDGQHFASTGEFKRWCELRLLEKAGEVRGLVRQKRYPLDVNSIHICDYIADFFYWERAGLFGEHGEGFRGVVEDYKSLATLTPIFAIKRKLMLACHGIEIRVTGKGIAPEPPTVAAARITGA